MDDLTTTQQRVLDELSEVRDSRVHLGALLQAVQDLAPELGTPVNAVNAVGVLTISSVSIHGETVTIGVDTYEFVADEAQTVSAEDHIPVDITSHTVKGSTTLTVDTRPTSGDTMTIGTKVYTFVPVGTDTADGEISIGADLAGAQANIIAAINGTDEFNEPHPLATIGTFGSDIATVEALIGGTGGNSIATTETFTAGTNVFAAAHLTSGSNCSGANTITALAAEILASGTEPVTATADSGHIDFAADVAGAAALDIVTTETMANGVFGHPHLTGGVDGTVADAAKILIDASYLYTCVTANTVAGKNWRQVSLGSAF